MTLLEELMMVLLGMTEGALLVPGRRGLVPA